MSREGRERGGREMEGEGTGTGPQFEKNDPPPVIRWLVTGLLCNHLCKDDRCIVGLQEIWKVTLITIEKTIVLSSASESREVHIYISVILSSQFLCVLVSLITQRLCCL